MKGMKRHLKLLFFVFLIKQLLSKIPNKHLECLKMLMSLNNKNRIVELIVYLK